MSRKVSAVVLKVQQLSKPTFVNGRWRKPFLSARELAKTKRRLFSVGVYFPPKPLRDRSNDKPLKLTKFERGKEGRQKRIEENMRRMPQMVAEYRQKIYDLRVQTREKKQRSEEQQYLIATGKISEAPHWQKMKEEKQKLQTKKKK